MNHALNAILNVPARDPDDFRRRRLLNSILLALTVVTAFATILALVSPAASPRLPLLGLVMILSNGIIYAINRFLSGQLASGLFLVLLVLIISFGDVPEQVVEGRTLFFLSVPILASSILMQPWASFVIAGFSALISAYLSGQAGIPVNTIGILGFFTIAFGTWLSARSLETALTDLRTVNRELDDRVELRTRELAEANERLKDLDRMKSKFVSDMSHELRTPVSNLTIYLDILETGERPDDRDRFLNVLREETNRLTTLVNDALDLSHLDLGAFTFEETTRIDLNKVVERLIAGQELRAGALGLDLSFSPSTGPAHILATQEQATRIVTNLLGNALKYTTEGRVGVSIRVEGGEVVLEIEDTGCGIAEPDLEHVFDRFYRGENVSQSTIPGSGLGLAIAKELVVLLGGEIVIRSRLNSGTMVTVRIPQAQPRPQPQPA